MSHSCCFFDGLRATLTHPANQEPKHALPGTCGPTWLLCRRSAGDMMTWSSGKGSVVSFKVPFPHGNSRIPPPTPPFQEIWPYQVVTNHRCPLLSAWWWQVVRSNYPCVDNTLVGLKICLYRTYPKIYTVDCMYAYICKYRGNCIYIYIHTNYTFLQICMFVSLYKVSLIPPSRCSSSTQGQDVRPYLVQYLACLDPCGAHLYGWHAASRLLAWTDGKDIAIWGKFSENLTTSTVDPPNDYSFL